MTQLSKFEQGQLAYKQGKSYKEESSAEWNRGWTKEERLSSCGFSNYHWSRSGVVASTVHGLSDFFNHTKQNTVRDGV